MDWHCTVMLVNGLVVVSQVMWLKNGASVVAGNGISVTPGVVSANTTILTLHFNPLCTSDGGQYSSIGSTAYLNSKTVHVYMYHK